MFTSSIFRSRGRVESDSDVPFDDEVSPGVGTETDERNNQGFETDELD